MGEFLHQGIMLGLKIQESMETKKLVEFKKLVNESEEVKAMLGEVKAFAGGFSMPGGSFKDGCW